MEIKNIQEIAELLHKKSCRWNHIDGCSWEYSNWNRPCSTRKEFYQKSIKILELHNFETVKSILLMF